VPWSAYDGAHIRLRHVLPKRSPIILTNSDGKPWTSDGFRASWRKACNAAGVVGITFHDLRGTAVTRFALAGCTEAEIAAITGLMRSVRAILDRSVRLTRCIDRRGRSRAAIRVSVRLRRSRSAD
jgi:hypothetical protein